MLSILAKGPVISKEVYRFLIVGLLATIVHSICLIVFVEFLQQPATFSNLGAFFVAVVTSYIGHFYWTYKTSSTHQKTFTRFFILAFVGFILNYLIFYLMVDTMKWHYLVALSVVITTIPLLTYLGQKYWVFRRA